MNNNENQYYIYIRGMKERIPVTKQKFDDYYRDINSYRRTEMNNGRCVCPRSKCHTTKADYSIVFIS